MQLVGLLFYLYTLHIHKQNGKKKMPRKRFRVIDNSTGEKCKLLDGEMIVMNNSGVFLIINDMNGYYTNVQLLSDRFPRYDVVWLEN